MILVLWSALQSARRVTEAHTERFQSDGYVVLRRLAPVPWLESLVDGDVSALGLESPAASCACRVLDAQRVLLVVAARHEKPRGESGVSVIVALEDVQPWLETPSRLQLDLCATDGVVVDAGTRLGGLRHCVVFTFTPESNKNGFPLAFEDPFYAGRGRTPVSVLQWSKGIPVAEQKMNE